jgi:superfamily I DNA/RNA helicase
LIAERIVSAVNNGTEINDIAVLARTKYLLRAIDAAIKRRGLATQSMESREIRDFDWSLPSVKLLTMHSCKGLEFPRVFVAGLQALPMKDDSVEDAVRLVYVAMTRATHDLTLSAHGGSVIVDRVKQSINVVRRQMQ